MDGPSPSVTDNDRSAHVSDAPASPQAGRLARPGWLDGRLVLGVLLVLVSVVVGARVLAAGDRTALVWTASRDLAPGTALSADDLSTARVRLFDAGARYLAAPDRGFVGYVLDRPVTRGELVPTAALQPPGATDVRFVSVPVQPGRYPVDLARGQRVDVWATPDASNAGGGAATSGGASAGPAPDSRLVLPAVPVSAAAATGSALAAGSAERSVLLAVPAADVARLVAAMTHSRIDLVRVPEAAPRGAAGAR
jgi:hypothetical protein